MANNKKKNQSRENTPDSNKKVIHNRSGTEKVSCLKNLSSEFKDMQDEKGSHEMMVNGQKVLKINIKLTFKKKKF